MAPLLLTLQFPPQAVPLLAATRDHWRIENSLHWVLDVAFREDESRLRKGHVARNMAVKRRLANSLLRRRYPDPYGHREQAAQGRTQFSLHGENPAHVATLRLPWGQVRLGHAHVVGLVQPAYGLRPAEGVLDALVYLQTRAVRLARRGDVRERSISCSRWRTPWPEARARNPVAWREPLGPFPGSEQYLRD